MASGGGLLGWGVAALVVLGAIGAMNDDSGSPPSDDRESESDASSAPSTNSIDDADRAPDEKPEPKPTGEPKPTEESEPQVRTYVVRRVVDGDTLDLHNGETVRLVGIDAPEVGECGHERAAQALADLVEGESITLGESDEDRDGYGRLLRYVDLGRVDAGFRLIREGLAIARYDSRDGYGRHPREDAYVTADARSPNVTCQPKPQPLVDLDPACAPGYSPCIPPYPPDLDCADTGPVRVTGDDPHGLDADGDGVACGGD